MPDTACRRIIRLVAPAALVAAAIGVTACGGGSHLASTAAGPTTATNARSLPGSGKPLVTIGDKNFTEQFVLGELYSQALTAQGYQVVLNQNIGPTEVTIQALYSGRLAMYPEYLGIWNTAVAGDMRTLHSARGALLAARRYATAHGLQLLRPTPFSDTGGIAVTVSYGSEHGLRAIGDLRKVAPTLTLGGPPQFQQSASGLQAIEQAYGLLPSAFKSLPIGNQYQALDQGVVQAADVSTTDGQLDSGNYTLLKDPLRAFGFGQVVPVVPTRVLLAEGPAFAATINRVSSMLSATAIRELNAAVDVYNQDPVAAAREFLQAHGLVPLGTA
jgi:osmoprotectant transport system substrate-binding protein